mmetsp:Transcript_23017/g.31548  ORF Transcript_23017/g.31548 Transcript_23017/m.31548 type:complete len:414 (+) Transcript_23017:2707-3948(+)
MQFQLFSFLSIILKFSQSLKSTSTYKSNDLHLNAMSKFDQSLGNRKLPERLIVGYANWNECDDNIVEAAKNGVNVIIWFSIFLLTSKHGEPIITNGPDMDCVGEKVQKIRELGLETIHLISVGGWNSPHPSTENSAETVYSHWDYWNRNIAARPANGFFGFDGFDWDVEGNDDPKSVYNHFTPECLDLMGRMSQLAKQDGYLVCMAPAESYLDPRMSGFDRSLLHEYEEWQQIQPGFAYHGLNTYAYLLHKYGKYPLLSPTGSASKDELYGDTFDFVTIQLYEGYSHAEYNTSIAGVPAAEYLVKFVSSIAEGWTVDFSTDTELNYPESKAFISLPPSRLVVGLANGWAGDGKFLLIYPHQVQEAFEELNRKQQQPRGFAFWNILDEGKASPMRPNEPVWLASGLNRFMDVRK